MQKYLPIHRITSTFLGLLAIVIVIASISVGGVTKALIQASILLFTVWCDTPIATSWIKKNILDIHFVEDLVLFSSITAFILYLGARHDSSTMLTAFFCGLWIFDHACNNAISIIRDEFNDLRDPFLHDVRRFYLCCGNILQSCWTPILGLLVLHSPGLNSLFSILIAIALFCLSYFEIRGALNQIKHELPYGIHTSLADLNLAYRLRIKQTKQKQ